MLYGSRQLCCLPFFEKAASPPHTPHYFAVAAGSSVTLLHVRLTLRQQAQQQRILYYHNQYIKKQPQHLLRRNQPLLQQQSQQHHHHQQQQTHQQQQQQQQQEEQQQQQQSQQRQCHGGQQEQAGEEEPHQQQLEQQLPAGHHYLHQQQNGLLSDRMAARWQPRLQSQQRHNRQQLHIILPQHTITRSRSSLEYRPHPADSIDRMHCTCHSKHWVAFADRSFTKWGSANNIIVGSCMHKEGNSQAGGPVHLTSRINHVTTSKTTTNNKTTTTATNKTTTTATNKTTTSSKASTSHICEFNPTGCSDSCCADVLASCRCYCSTTDDVRDTWSSTGTGNATECGERCTSGGKAYHVHANIQHCGISNSRPRKWSSSSSIDRDSNTTGHSSNNNTASSSESSSRTTAGSSTSRADNSSSSSTTTTGSSSKNTKGSSNSKNTKGSSNANTSSSTTTTTITTTADCSSSRSTTADTCSSSSTTIMDGSGSAITDDSNSTLTSESRSSSVCTRLRNIYTFTTGDRSSTTIFADDRRSRRIKTSSGNNNVGTTRDSSNSSSSTTTLNSSSGKSVYGSSLRASRLSCKNSTPSRGSNTLFMYLFTSSSHENRGLHVASTGRARCVLMSETTQVDTRQRQTRVYEAVHGGEGLSSSAACLNAFTAITARRTGSAAAFATVAASAVSFLSPRPNGSAALARDSAAAVATSTGAVVAWRRESAAGIASHVGVAETPKKTSFWRRVSERLVQVRDWKRLWLSPIVRTEAATSDGVFFSIGKKRVQSFQKPLLLLQTVRQWIINKSNEKEDLCLLLISLSWLLLLSGFPLYFAWKRRSRDRRHPYLAKAHQIVEENKDIKRVFGSPLLLKDTSDTTESTGRFKRAEIKIYGPKASGTVFVSAAATDSGTAGEDGLQSKLSYAEMAALLREQPYLLKFFVVEKVRLLLAALWTVVRGGVFSAAAGSSSNSNLNINSSRLYADSSSEVNREAEVRDTKSSTRSSTEDHSGTRDDEIRTKGWKIESIFAVVHKEKRESNQSKSHHQRHGHLGGVEKQPQANQSCSATEENTASALEDEEKMKKEGRRKGIMDQLFGKWSGNSPVTGNESTDIIASGRDKSLGHPHIILLEGNPYNNPDFLPQLQPEGGDRLQRSHPIGWLVLSLLMGILLRRLSVELVKAKHRVFVRVPGSRMLLLPRSLLVLPRRVAGPLLLRLRRCLLLQVIAYAYLRHFVSSHPHLRRLLCRAGMKRRLLREREAGAVHATTGADLALSISHSPSRPCGSSSAVFPYASTFAGASTTASSVGEPPSSASARAQSSVIVRVEFFTGVMDAQHIKGTASLSYWCRPPPIAATRPAFACSSAETHRSTAPSSASAATGEGTSSSAATIKAYECVAELEIEAYRRSSTAPFRAVTSKLSLIEESDAESGDPPFPLIKSYLLNPHTVTPFRPRLFSWWKKSGENISAVSAAAAT